MRARSLLPSGGPARASLSYTAAAPTERSFARTAISTSAHSGVARHRRRGRWSFLATSIWSFSTRPRSGWPAELRSMVGCCSMTTRRRGCVGRPRPDSCIWTTARRSRRGSGTSGTGWPRGRQVVDAERVLRLLRGIETDVRFLERYVGRSLGELVTDDTALRAIKYAFITAIEGCARVAHHIGASQGWPPAETNADAVRQLGREGVLTPDLARSIADAVGFRKLLVRQYGDVDDERAIGHLAHLPDVRDFATWVALSPASAPGSTRSGGVAAATSPWTARGARFVRAG
jgi:uncharacterized protein YutE (UPF0331/DUF86 family)